MNESAVISYIISSWIVWLIILTVLGIIFIIFSFIKRIKKYRWWILILLFIYTVYISIPTIQGIIDIKNNSFITEQVEYYRDDESSTRNSFVASDSIQITQKEGNTIFLRGARNSFPFGKHTATVTYSKRSKIIIDVVVN